MNIYLRTLSSARQKLRPQNQFRLCLNVLLDGCMNLWGRFLHRQIKIIDAKRMALHSFLVSLEVCVWV